MYSALGQQAPMLQRTNPDGSVTYYFGPVENIVKSFPAATGATIIPEADRQAIEAQARRVAPSGGLPGWLVPAAVGGLALVFLWRR